MDYEVSCDLHMHSHIVHFPSLYTFSSG